MGAGAYVVASPWAPPSLLLAILLMLIGVQFITMGLLGEIMVRTYHEAVQKSIYVVRDVLGEDEGPDTDG